MEFENISKHKSLAVIGASYLQRPLVEKAKENNSTK